MKIQEYENTNGESMVLIIDEENNKAESMTLKTYEERLTAKEASGIIL